MSFAVIRASERTSRMVTWFSGIQNRITDFIVGSKARTKIEALAVELEQQDLAFYQALKKAIPVSVYNSFGFGLLASVAASGTVTFSRVAAATQNIIIPVGAQVSTRGTLTEPEKTYSVLASVTLVTGQTSVSASVACTVGGLGGNTGAATITNMKTTIPGIDAVTNASAFTNGQPAESEGERRLRFQEFIAGLGRAPRAGIAWGAKQAQLLNGSGQISERVTEAMVFDPSAAPWGEVAVWIYNGAGYNVSGGASSSLVARAQEIIDGYIDGSGVAIVGYKAAGVVATVTAVTTKKVDITGTITVATGSNKTTVKTQADAALVAYISSLAIGETGIKSEMIQRIMDIDGVTNVAISAPAGDTSATSSYASCEVLVPGDFTGLTVP